MSRRSRTLAKGATVIAAVVATSVLAPAAVADSPEQILAKRPFAPTDPAMFDTYFFPDSPPFKPAAGPKPTPDQVQAMLADYLTAEHPGDAGAQASAEAVYNDPEAQSKIPDATLRAGLAALRGTIADGAIDFVLHATTADGSPLVTEARFANPGELTNDLYIAEVRPVGGGDQEHILFNPTFAAESPFLFLSTWAHEPLHQDREVANREEAVNHSLDMLVYLHELVRHPELASMGTQLAREINTQAMIRLNSGTGSALGLFATNDNAYVVPGVEASGRSWAFDFTDPNDDTATPGNELLGSYLANIHTPGAPPCSAAEFSQALLDCIDAQGDAGLSPDDLVADAAALRLDTSGEASPTTPACSKARSALDKAKAKLKKLRRHDAPRKVIAKAKQKVRKAKDAVASACSA